MRFVIDLDSLELIESATDRRRVVQVEGKRGDDSPFEVSFVRTGVAEELAASSVLTFGAKESGKYDAAAVVLNSDFTLSGSGTSAKYLANPSFNTEELNDLFLIDADDSNDPPYVDLMAEFSWQVGSGAPTSCRTFAFRVHNDVIRDDEFSPTPGYAAIGDTAPVNAVAGTAQVETITLAGTQAGAGTFDCTITSALLSGGLYGFNGVVADGITAAGLASIINGQINTIPTLSVHFTASVSTGTITLTCDVEAANDATLNIAITITGGSGISSVPTSTNTTTGVAPILATETPPFIRTAGGYLYIQEAGVWKKTALSAL